MFETPTVFILGAGASWHYGYPTGENLVKDVVKKAETVIKIIEDCEGNVNFLDPIVSTEYVQQKIISPIYVPLHLHLILENQCRNLASRLKQINPPVIDYFLGENKDLQDIGKLMIAWVILECESKQIDRCLDGPNNNQNRIRAHKDSPHYNPSDSKPDIKKFNDDWYRFILYRLTLGCKNPEDLLENDVSFVTFNYDVSLERVLKEGLSCIQFFQDDNNVVNQFLTPGRFLHLYGKVRQDPFSRPQQIDFALPSGKGKRSQWLKLIMDAAYIASQGIRTIHEEKNKDPDTINEARERIRDASDVFILGYGFDENNSECLGLHESLEINDDNLKRIFFTNYEDKQSINKRASLIFSGRRGNFGPNSPYVIESEPFGSSLAEKSTRNVYDAIEQDFDFSD